jgi:hypothetical protein
MQAFLCRKNKLGKQKIDKMLILKQILKGNVCADVY